MEISDVINRSHLDISSETYLSNAPFPHIVLDDFIESSLIDEVEKEFPDLSKVEGAMGMDSTNQRKFASKGFGDLSPAAEKLISFLNSDVFLVYLQKLTSIEAPLISDPYLEGGGYHEIKNGGFLKTHVDYNVHPKVPLDRRINLLLYLNRDWEDGWNGSLGLFDVDDLTSPKVSVRPIFNRCVIFSTTSFSYHGHPEAVNCPPNRSRRSLALYYFSMGRPSCELSPEGKSDPNQTFWIGSDGKPEIKRPFYRVVLKRIMPPIIVRLIRRLEK